MSYITSKFVNKIEVCVVISDPVLGELASGVDYAVARTQLRDALIINHERGVEYVAIDGHAISFMVIPHLQDKEDEIVQMCTNVVQEWLNNTEV